MTTRVTFNFGDCFAFNAEFTSWTTANPELVKRTTNDFVRFARHVNAMVIEHPPYRNTPKELPFTRFVAISPGIKLQTSYLPTGCDTTAYIREALKPFTADDATYYGDGDAPPKGHYSVCIENEVRLTLREIQDDVYELTQRLESIREHLAAPELAVPTLTRSQRRQRREVRDEQPTSGKSSRKKPRRSPYGE